MHQPDDLPNSNPLERKPAEFYRQQHKLRLSYMPWLYYSLKPAQRQWAQAWQDELQAYLQTVETIQIGKNCFVAPEARLFAEPGRPIVIGDNSYIAADAVIHGPVTIGQQVSINHHITMDGGTRGIAIGDHTRIAAHCQLYAFNHSMLPDRLISEQPTRSSGITIGSDVWLGANVGIVVGMGSQVTRSVAKWQIVAGNPASPIGDRREKK
jgi:acetyltransferase-like isoleucine patch superfamily enzyme